MCSASLLILNLDIVVVPAKFIWDKFEVWVVLELCAVDQEFECICSFAQL